MDRPPTSQCQGGLRQPAVGGGMPQYFDLSGQKVMPTRCEDQARDLFNGKVTPIMLQVETVSAVDLPEGRCGEFVLDHAHLHLLDRIQAWCDEDVSDDHPEVTRMEQPDGTWSFMADGVVQLILRALGLLPHTSMIQMGDEGAALSAGVLPAAPPVMISVTTATDGALTVTVQKDAGEPWSDSNLSRGRGDLRWHRGKMSGCHPRKSQSRKQGNKKGNHQEEEGRENCEKGAEAELIRGEWDDAVARPSSIRKRCSGKRGGAGRDNSRGTTEAKITTAVP